MGIYGGNFHVHSVENFDFNKFNVDKNAYDVHEGVERGRTACRFVLSHCSGCPGARRQRDKVRI